MEGATICPPPPLGAEPSRGMEGGRRMISIDRWSESSQAYFLTHLHADHTKGLSSKWSRGPLFCSPISARLLPLKFPGFDLSLIKVLDIGTTNFIPLVSTASGLQVSVEVTAIDAHHCPGAVMYLFKGEFGCILHTGDFRWEPESARACQGRKALVEALSGDKVDLLYLDNTYCHPSFSFPSRDIAARQVIDIIKSYPNHDIVIGIDQLGKEELLLQIAHFLNIKIWVWPERLQTMHILELADVFTTNTCLTRVRAVPRYSLTVSTLTALNKFWPTIGIMPSGLPWLVKSFNQYDDPMASSPVSYFESKESAADTHPLEPTRLNYTTRHHPYIYTIPYSDHSCFSEIKDLIDLVQPIKITGIVSPSVCYTIPGQYFQAGNLPDHINFDLKRSLVGQSRRISLQVENQRCKKTKNKKEILKSTRLLVRKSRVSLLRRGRCGVKLLESETSAE